MIDAPPVVPVALPGSFRVGTDLVEVETVASSIARFGDRYLSRVFTAAELSYCQSAPASEHSRLAARFAAKEAALKVLRPDGWWPQWRCIEVVRHPQGWCTIQLHGDVARFAARQGVDLVACSLSHEGAYASAVVLGTVSPPAT